MEKKLAEFYRFMNTFTNNLSSTINRDIIPSKWLDSQEGSKERMLHGRMLWILAKTGDVLDYVVEIDTGFKYFIADKTRQFRPDVQLWTKEPKLQFLIEYEGTNSQDSRILWKDLQHYYDSTDCNYPPEYWLILYTFPDHPVDKVPQWLRQESTFDSFAERHFKRNPHHYFKSLLDTELSANIGRGLEWDKRMIFLINLTSTGLEIDFPKQFNRKYYFEATTE